jgi:hypothetical protein
VQKRKLWFLFSAFAVVFTRFFPFEHKSPHSFKIVTLKDRFPSGET